MTVMPAKRQKTITACNRTILMGTVGIVTGFALISVAMAVKAALKQWDKSDVTVTDVKGILSSATTLQKNFNFKESNNYAICSKD